jgi:hypothetical protein
MDVLKKSLNVVRSRLSGSDNRGIRDDLRLFFLHLPKCGGSSVRNALASAVDPEKIAALHPHASRRAAAICGEDMLCYRASLLPYYMAMGDVSVLTGHFPWSDEAYEQFGEEWTYATVLRHPVRRWFSHYFYDRYKEHSDHFKIGEDLSTFLQSERAHEMGALYARRLSDPEVVRVDQAAEQAKENLERFDVVGVLDDLHVLNRKLEEYLGVELEIEKKNESPARDRKQNAMQDEAIRGEVEDLCAADLEIYNHIRERNAEEAQS